MANLHPTYKFTPDGEAIVQKPVADRCLRAIASQQNREATGGDRGKIRTRFAKQRSTGAIDN